MKVILLRSIDKVGKKDEVVTVSDGYAHNALFPKKYAIPATAQALEQLKRRQAGVVAEQALQHQLLEKAFREVENHPIEIKARASGNGSLFAKITAKEIAAGLLKSHRLSIDPKIVVLPEPIKHTGTYQVPVVFDSFKGMLTVAVVPVV